MRSRHVHELAVAEFVESDGGDGCGRGVHGQLIHEQLIKEVIDDRDLLRRDRFVVLRPVEPEAHDGAEVAIFCCIWQVHGVHLEVVVLAFEGVLGLRVEMELRHFESTLQPHVV